MGGATCEQVSGGRSPAWCIQQAYSLLQDLWKWSQIYPDLINKQLICNLCNYFNYYCSTQEMMYSLAYSLFVHLAFHVHTSSPPSSHLCILSLSFHSIFPPSLLPPPLLDHSILLSFSQNSPVSPPTSPTAHLAPYLTPYLPSCSFPIVDTIFP